MTKIDEYIRRYKEIFHKSKGKYPSDDTIGNRISYLKMLNLSLPRDELRDDMKRIITNLKIHPKNYIDAFKSYLWVMYEWEDEDLFKSYAKKMYDDKKQAKNQEVDKERRSETKNLKDKEWIAIIKNMPEKTLAQREYKGIIYACEQGGRRFVDVIHCKLTHLKEEIKELQLPKTKGNKFSSFEISNKKPLDFLIKLKNEKKKLNQTYLFTSVKKIDLPTLKRIRAKYRAYLGRHTMKYIGRRITTHAFRRYTIKTLALLGYSDREICNRVDVTREVYEKHYLDDITKEKLNKRISETYKKERDLMY